MWKTAIVAFVAAFAGAFAGPAGAAAIPMFNPQQLAIPATGIDLNTLVGQINGIITPLLPTIPGAVNQPQLSGAVSGSPVIIGVQPGGDSNASISLQPGVNGNLIFIGGTANAQSYGLIQFASFPEFVPAKGFAACPAVLPGTGGGASVTPGQGYGALGISPTVTGYIQWRDWLSRDHWMVSC